MNFRTLLCLLFTTFSVFISSSLSSQEVTGLAQYLVENENSCVTQISGAKVYIDAESIFPSNEGLYIKTDLANYIPVPYLQADAEGCYLTFDTKVTRPCFACGTERISGAIPCPNIHCPTRKENRDK